MPELPEVETIKRELKSEFLGKKIIDVFVNNPKVIREPGQEGFVKGLKNATIKNILRKGKLLILELSSGCALTIHLKMTGQLVYPGNGKTSRVSFKFSNGKLLDFNDQRLFADLRLVEDWHALRFIQRLGPEPFGLNTDKFDKMLENKKTKIKPLLMDQAFISGVGNLYAAEALFRAGISPERSAQSLTANERKKLLKEIKDTLREATRHKGSSVDNYVHLNGKRGNYAKYHKVYGRNGLACLVCKKPIKRISLAGRGSYFCPNCQK